MCVLTKENILELIKKGKIKIEPFNETQVGPGSIDLTMSNEFRRFKQNSELELKEDMNIDDYTERFIADEIVLKPNEFVHGITAEKITLPDNVCGLLHGRSKFARTGLLVHATASFIQPGVSNRQVFEIKNISPVPLKLKKGLKIGQLVLIETKGKAKYHGSFEKQETI